MVVANARQTVSIEDGELEAVEPDQPLLCTEPDVSARALYDGLYGDLRESMLGRPTGMREVVERLRGVHFAGQAADREFRIGSLRRRTCRVGLVSSIIAAGTQEKKRDSEFTAMSRTYHGSSDLNTEVRLPLHNLPAARRVLPDPLADPVSSKRLACKPVLRNGGYE